MPDDISPPPGFSLVGQSDAAASPQPDVAPPPGFSLVSKPAQEQQPQSGGTLRDMGRGLGLGLQQGAANVLGFPSDLWQMLDRGYQWTLTKAGEKMGMITPEEGEAMRQPVPGMEDYHYTSKAIMDRFKKADESLGASTAGPNTVPGQYAETAGEFGVGAGALGASEARQIPAAVARYGLLPAATSETAGQVTKGTPLEPYARVAGAIGGAGPSMAWDAMRSGARGAAAAANDLSPQQRQAAQSLLDQSRQAGMPLSVPEAVQHATNGATSLGDIQRVVEQSTRGGPPMRQFYAQRPGQNEQAMRQTLAGISPSSAPLEETAANVQNAANSAVSDADRARTQAVRPYYQAAATDQVPLQDMQNFLGRIDTMAARDRTGILSPALTQLRDRLTFQGQPITDIENLETVREFFRDRMAQPQWAQDAIPKKANGQVRSLLGDLRTMMQTNSQPFAQGRQLYQDISNATVNPLQRSPTGQLAAADTFPKQANILFNPNPAPGSETAVGNAIRSVAARDPDAAAQLVRAHIESTFNETTQQLRSGPNQWGGAKFASVVAGNPQQAANLEAAVRALPNGDLRWNGLNNTLRIMQAQGMRQPVGSQTEFNRLLVQELRGGTALGTVMATAASPGRLSRFASDVYQNFTYGRNTQRLADLFTTGNIDDIRRLAQVPARSIGGQAAVAAYLGEGYQQQHPSPDGRAAGGGLSDGPGDLDALIDQASARYGVSAPLIRRVMAVESGGTQHAVSNQGALGPMQLMPATAKSLGVTDPFDYAQAINAGAKLLREGMDRNDGRVDLAVAEYHGGPDRRQWGPKTAAYVGKVLGPGNEISQASQESPPPRSRQEPMTAEAPARPARPAPLMDFGDEIDPTQTGGDDIDRRITAENMNLLADAGARTTA